MVFKALDPSVRFYDEYVTRAQEAQAKNAGKVPAAWEDVVGHTGYSPLHEIEGYNMQTQVVLDPMHNQDLGCTRRLFVLT